jgi:3-(3-hydroxy-phenyl)propionate hydroxylase
MNSDRACDVVVVGGGPAGVTLAVLLAMRGVAVIVAEKDAAIRPARHVPITQIGRNPL